MNIETHSHSYHSFDSLAKIEDIVEKCKTLNIKAIVINDHDVCNITTEEENYFIDNDIKLLKAIEFTTEEGMHIIGIGENIKLLQIEPYTYSAINLVDKLNQDKYWIIIPHPLHGTGVVGNINSNKQIQEQVLRNAHFIECSNYRYGNSVNKVQELTKSYSNLKMIVGSDAHKAKDIGAHYNKISNFDSSKSILEQLYENELEFVYTKQRSSLYFLKRKIKKTKLYQATISILSPELRLKIKRKLKLI